MNEAIGGKRKTRRGCRSGKKNYVLPNPETVRTLFGLYFANGAETIADLEQDPLLVAAKPSSKQNVGYLFMMSAVNMHPKKIKKALAGINEKCERDVERLPGLDFLARLFDCYAKGLILKEGAPAERLQRTYMTLESI